MAEYYLEGECIDGKRVLLELKKIPNSFVFSTSPTGFKGVKYKCSRDCFAKITTILEKTVYDSAKGKKSTVHLDIDDAIKCNKLFFVAESKRKLNCFDVKMMSGRHECSKGTPDVRVYAEIETPFASIMNAIDARLLKEQQKRSNQLEEQKKIE